MIFKHNDFCISTKCDLFNEKKHNANGIKTNERLQKEVFIFVLFECFNPICFFMVFFFISKEWTFIAIRY